jgi:NAD(P)-dependent dehydrogenase (short-subunit alcohol dehydrogenase family)
MERRDILKGMAVAAAAAAPAAIAEAQVPSARSQAPRDPRARDIKPTDPDYFAAGRLKGKTLLVTGCARGMGAAAAIRAAKEGANVVGVDWLPDQGAAVIEGIRKAGGKAVFLAGDVGDAAVCDRMVALAVSSFGGLDLALNNAGVMDGVFSGDPIDLERQRNLVFAPIHEASDEYMERVIRTNTLGVFRSMRSELKQMIAQGRGGAIVNVGSIAGLTGLAGNPAYVASQARRHRPDPQCRASITRRLEFSVNSVNMAATDTPMVDRAGKLVAALNKPTSPNMGRLKTNSRSLSYADTNASRPRDGLGTGFDDAVPAVGRSVELHRRTLCHRRGLDSLLTCQDGTCPRQPCGTATGRLPVRLRRPWRGGGGLQRRSGRSRQS